MKVTEHEMRGLLTGKCVPADMLVNEELPAYLVRKFADLHSDIKKQETAYAQAVDSILMALKDKELVQDRLEGTEDKLQESREKLDAVLAENVALKGFFETGINASFEGCDFSGDHMQSRALELGLIRDDVYCKDQHENLVVDPGNFEDGDTVFFINETPATDAILNEVRAEGAQYCIDAIVTSDSADFIDAPNICAEVMRQLRAGITEGGV